jgi:cytoskeleton protein RodZ
MTYVRGYLRSYAQLLGLAAEPILEAHTRLIGGPQPVVLPSLSPPPQATSGHRHIKLTSYLVASIVVGLAMLWWHGNNKLPAPELARLGNTTPPQTPEPMGPPDNAQTPPAAPLTNADHSYMHTPTPSSETAVAPPRAAPAVAPARAQLSLYIEQESWIEVRDGQQNRLVYESLPAGRTLMLEGMVPLYVFLGNANGVRVEFDGKPFDLTPHKRGQVARFALGQGAVTTNAPAQEAVR